MPLEVFTAYLPTDRRHALARGAELPTHTTGAALFADIAGFTPLTEALFNALGPQRGAEELTRQLNTVFAALITELDQYQGSVLGFSGDAITCWFDGAVAPAAHRAVTCGLAMQAAMQQFVALQLSTGVVVTLAMKVAIAAGPARRFVVGNPEIQSIDVLAGATLDRVAAIEKHAQRGEVLVDAATLIWLGNTAQVGRTADEFSVVQSLTQPTLPQPWPALDETRFNVETLRAWILPPVFARLREGQAQFLAEIRPSVALFLSFGGIDYDTDPHAQYKLDIFIRRLQTLLQQQEASLLQLTLGDKGCYLYAAFGAPLAHADDPRRAVTVALAVQGFGQEFDFIHDIRIGVNQGRIWSGAYGGPTRYTYGALGDMVNVAARLMSHAQPGAILISPTLAEAVETDYELRSLGALVLKGKAQPLPTYQVVRPFARPTHAWHVLEGRDTELARLSALWQATQSGRGQVVRLLGAPGVGKSHLMREFSIELANQDVRVSASVCRAAEQTIAYRPWRAIVWQWLNLADDLPHPLAQAEAAQAALSAFNPDWQIRAPLLGEVLDLPIPDNPATAALDPPVRHDAVSALVVDILRAVAQQRPLLIGFDDIQSMDEASIALTRAVSRALENSPVLLLCSQQAGAEAADPFIEWAHWPTYHSLTLAPLPTESLTRITEQHVNGPVQALALSLIHRQARGNVFYARELAQAMREEGQLIRYADEAWQISERLWTLLQTQHYLTHDPQTDQWVLLPEAPISAEALGLPDSLQRTITARIDQLAPETQLTTKTASVIGPTFELDILEMAHPQSPGRAALEAHLAEVVRRGLVHRVEQATSHAYQFEHPLIQDGIYNTLVADQQQQLHGAVGQALETLRPEAVEPLAQHFSRARARDKALRYLGQAADKAKRAYANETALKYYEQALTLDERWEWRKAQIEILHTLARREEERAALTQLEALSTAPAFDVAYLWGQYYESVSDYTQAQAAFERAHQLAREHAEVVNGAKSLIQLGVVAFSIGGNPGGAHAPGASRGNGGVGASRGNGGVGSYRAGGGSYRAGGGSLRSGHAPLLPPDGQLIFFTANNTEFITGSLFTVQSMASLPPLPPGRALVGSGYAILASPGVTLPAGSVSVQYLSNDVTTAGAREDDLSLCFYDGAQWAELPTTRDAYFNVLVAASDGPGLYAVFASVQIPLEALGWNLVAYPLAQALPVTDALASLQGSYELVYGYRASDPVDPWEVFTPNGVPPYVNDLTQLEPGRGYWISATQVVTWYLEPLPPSGLSAPASASSLSQPPSTFYGAVVGDATFTPQAGMMVQAYINGVLCGQGVTQDYNGQVVYVVDVAGAALGGPAGCGAPGAMVHFTIAGRALAAVGQWTNDTLTLLNLVPARQLYLPVIRR